jgi:hypothetical protein
LTAGTYAESVAFLRDTVELSTSQEAMMGQSLRRVFGWAKTSAAKAN